MLCPAKKRYSLGFLAMRSPASSRTSPASENRIPSPVDSADDPCEPWLPVLGSISIVGWRVITAGMTVLTCVVVAVGVLVGVLVGVRVGVGVCL